MIRRSIVILVFGVLLWGLSPLVNADQVTVRWNANTESDLGGYVLHYGTEHLNYTTSLDVGNVIEQVLNLDAGEYYFTVVAYDTTGNESQTFTEVYYRVLIGEVKGITVE